MGHQLLEVPSELELAFLDLAIDPVGDGTIHDARDPGKIGLLDDEMEDQVRARSLFPRYGDQGFDRLQMDGDRDPQNGPTDLPREPESNAAMRNELDSNEFLQREDLLSLISIDVDVERQSWLNQISEVERRQSGLEFHVGPFGETEIKETNAARDGRQQLRERRFRESVPGEWHREDDSSEAAR